MEEKKPLFTTNRLLFTLICFVAFMVLGVGSYYYTAGEFVTAQMAIIYVALALVGALAVFFRLRWFAIWYYIGCGLGWAAGQYIAGLKGGFAHTAGTICTFFLIAVFTLLGITSQWNSMKKHRARRKEAEAKAAAEAEEARAAAELEEARKEREAAAAILAEGGLTPLPVEPPFEMEAPAVVEAPIPEPPVEPDPITGESAETE